MNNYQELTDEYGSYCLSCFNIQNKVPVVSIVMSVYNGMPFLIESIKSVLQQTWTGFEFIIINDGSSDDSGEYLKRIQENDRRIILIKQPNLGLTKSLNRGIKISKGEYIARIDSDDIWLPDKLQLQIQWLKHNPSYGLIGCAYKEIDSKGVVVANPPVPLLIDNDLLHKSLSSFNPFFHASVVFTRNAIEKVGLYNDKFIYAQDYELWGRILSCFKGYNIDKILAYKRVTENIISIKHERLQRYYAMRAKIIFFNILNNGFFSFMCIAPDLMVILLPKFFLKFLRNIKKSLKNK